MKNHPERFLWTALGALRWGYELARPMTSMERALIALMGVPPTHLITIHGPPGTKVSSWWPRYRKRIDRARGPSRPLIYLGVRASGFGDGGEHLHLLLWDEWIPFWVLHRHADECGLGKPHVDLVPDPQANRLECASMVTYVLSQHEPVFGSRNHERHHQPHPHQRRWIRPHQATLRTHRPQLLSALNAAESPSISDKELVSKVLTFSNKTERNEDEPSSS